MPYKSSSDSKHKQLSYSYNDTGLHARLRNGAAANLWLRVDQTHRISYQRKVILLVTLLAPLEGRHRHHDAALWPFFAQLCS